MTSIETLADVLKKHYPRMKGLGGGVKDQELAYIWRVFDMMMTDITSKALDLYKEDMRHDTLAMEAKPHSQLAGRRADL
ncbi:hypothetical protein BGZ98_002977 [Dissophora globulifera]|nr:hypothetical protein BGZ98_002977 [Dissophora globulifera]